MTLKKRNQLFRNIRGLKVGAFEIGTVDEEITEMVGAKQGL